MELKKLLFIPMAFGAGALAADAANVSVVMNTTSKTMTLQSKATNEQVETGDISGTTYTFEAPAGDYILTAYATDGETVNGTMELTVTDTDETQEFKVLTCTVYAKNTGWTVANGDYTIDATVNTREGKKLAVTLGQSTTANRHTFLALNGNSYFVSFIPSEEHVKEGYTTSYKAGTLTGNVNIIGDITKGGDYTITLPADADLEIGFKKSHFTDFDVIEPKESVINGDNKEVTYYLAQEQVYSYRTWKEGGLTQGGYFTYAADEAKRPAISFSDADYKAFDPKTIVHDVNYNQGYETGDIFVNINERGHLSMNVGETFKAHAMRTWELTDNSFNNYFIEPDFHYTVIGLDGKPSSDVIEISSNPASSWADIKAVGQGTAIVLVTYDAIGLNYYSGATKTNYMGGEYWSAIWPENTAAYVVSVSETASTVVPNMLINEEYNKDTLKNAGKYVDAEHDVFYYLDTEDGAYYTFTPEGVADITIAYPQIGADMATYNGFGTDGVTKNENGSYTLLLKEGRQIVKMTDANGNAAYQVLTAKPCHREIVNASRPGSEIFQPGDQIKIQYSGLRHPANKLAGIYNMSAYVTYNGIPNGTSLILGSGQYTFGSAASAQAVTVTIPDDYDVATNPAIEMTEGVIQVNGFGDPIGNHRIIDPVAGRSANFTAVAHKTYFGAIPDVIIPISAYQSFPIKITSNVPDADITVSFKGNAIEPDETTGLYTGTYGDYQVVAAADGFRCYREVFTIGDDAEGEQTFNIEMSADENVWNGKTLTEPAVTDGAYNITSGAELAWFATEVNNGNSADARLANDIDLGDYDWTPIGNSSSKPFTGNFDGCGYSVHGLYINTPATSYCGLFGYAKAVDAQNPASIKNVTVHGTVSAKQYSAGVAGYIHQYTTVERCANYADVTGVSTYIGGVVGYIGSTSGVVTDSYNAGNINGTSNCAGVVGGHTADATVRNVYNIGAVAGSNVAACVGGTTSKTNVSNLFATEEYNITTNHTLVTDDQMASGEVAYRLGDAFGQTIGEDAYPVIGGEKVYKVNYNIIAAPSEISLLSDDEDNILYTNSNLPAELNGEKVNWYADEAMTQPVSSIESDTTLYARIDDPSGIEDINIDNATEARWFNLQGMEVSAPAAGTRGIFIRVANGRSQKLIF